MKFNPLTDINPLFQRGNVLDTSSTGNATAFGATLTGEAAINEVQQAGPQASSLLQTPDASSVRAQLFGGAVRTEGVGPVGQQRGGPGPYGDLYPRIMAPGGGHYEALVSEHNGLPLGRA